MSAPRLDQAASARQARPGTSGRKTSFLQPPEPFSRPLSNRQLKRSQDISVLQDTQGLTEAMSGQRVAETRLGTCYHLLADRNVRAPLSHTTSTGRLRSQLSDQCSRASILQEVMAAHGARPGTQGGRLHFAPTTARFVRFRRPWLGRG